MVAPGKSLQCKILIENLSVQANLVAEFKEGQVANAHRDWPVLTRAGVRWVPRCSGLVWSRGTVAWTGLKTGDHRQISTKDLEDRRS